MLSQKIALGNTVISRSNLGQLHFPKENFSGSICNASEVTELVCVNYTVLIVPDNPLFIFWWFAVLFVVFFCTTIHPVCGNIPAQIKQSLTIHGSCLLATGNFETEHTHVLSAGC